MALDPSRTVAELKELRELTGDEDGAQRVAWTETWERARRWLAGRLADRPLRARRSTRPATSGSRSAGESERAVLIGGHIDSVPNGGWLDGCAERRRRRRGAAPDRRRRARRRSRSGSSTGPTRRARASAAALFGSSAAAGSMADQDELRAAHGPRRRLAPGRARRARRRPRPSARGPAPARLRGRLPRAAHRAGARPRVARPAARRRARHLRRRAPPHHVARPGGARGLDADGPAPRRARRRGEARARDPRDRGAHGRRSRLHLGRRRVQTGHRDVGRRDRRAAARPAPSRRRQARARCSPRRRTRASDSPPRRTSTSRSSGIWSIEPILFDETLIGFCDEAVTRGRRNLAPPAVRPAPRRGRGLACGRARP